MNTFKFNNETVENNGWMFEGLDGIERVMITPGITKYEMLHKNRKDLLGIYDTEIEKHSVFLFIGFGFNDNQLIKGSLEKKLLNQECPALIITRDSNERIEELAKKCKKLWLVCKPQNTDNKGTRIFNSRYQNEVLVDNQNLWDAESFAKEILGI